MRFVAPCINFYANDLCTAMTQVKVTDSTSTCMVSVSFICCNHGNCIYNHDNTKIYLLVMPCVRLGVDAIVTNKPENVCKVLRERRFYRKFRLATPDDDPFVTAPRHGKYRVGCSPQVT